MTMLPFIIRYAQLLPTNMHASPDSKRDHPNLAVDTRGNARCTRETRVKEETTDDE
jgi:hypothetical protein